MELLINKDDLSRSGEIKNELNIEKLSKDELLIEANKKNFEGIIDNVIDKGTDYIIKGMPINDSLKDILIDVKKAFKTKDFKQIIKTAVNSSIREGLEIVGSPVSVIKDVIKLKDVAMQGGLKQAITAGIDIIKNKYIKNNLLADVIIKFFDTSKQFINSNMFNIKIEDGLKKLNNKIKNFNNLCANWYNSYEKLDILNMNSITKKLKEIKKSGILDEDNRKENDIIQNMMSLINVKKEKLSQTQLQICQTL